MGVNRYVYADGDASWYDTFVARVEKQSKGYNGVSLTNYSTAATCAICEGSAWEQAGGVCYVTADTAISGSVATGICYIYSTAATDAANITWNQNEPAWRSDYHGYYWSAGSTVRCVGAAWFDNNGYYPKMIIKNENQLTRKYSSIDVYNGTWDTGNREGWKRLDGATSPTEIVPLELPHGAYVKTINLYYYSASQHYAYIHYRMKDLTASDYADVTTIVTGTYAYAASVANYVTITTQVASYNIIDKSRYNYWVCVDQNLGDGEIAYVMGGTIEYMDLLNG